LGCRFGHFGSLIDTWREFLTEVLPWNEEFDAPQSLDDSTFAEFASDLSEKSGMLIGDKRSGLCWPTNFAINVIQVSKTRENSGSMRKNTSKGG